MHGIHLRFVHDSDEPAVDVDDDVSLANAALVCVGLLLHTTQNKMKTRKHDRDGTTETIRGKKKIREKLVFCRGEGAGTYGD